MKFVVESTYWNDEEHLLKYYPFLREYGFETAEVTVGVRTIKKSYIYITSLEELLRLYEQCKEEIVLTRDVVTGEKCIEIYDGYRE